MKRFQTLIICAMLLTSSVAYADFGKRVTFKNERGSTMTLFWESEHLKEGPISGTFKSAVSECKAAKGAEMPVTGVYNGNAVAITVNYPECGTVLAMSGNVNKDYSEMNLHWFMTQQGKDTLNESWNTTTTGLDEFKKK